MLTESQFPAQSETEPPGVGPQRPQQAKRIMNYQIPGRELTNETMISIVTPAFNEAENLPLFYAKLVEVLDKINVAWEWIIVDDHSRDATFDVLSGLAQRDGRVRGVRFSRNFGSHIAMMCGLEQAQGNVSVLLASDLQDPPELIPELLQKWREGVDIVLAVRAGREQHAGLAALASKLYYFLMRDLVGLKQLPTTGADFFLLDRKVVRELVKLREVNLSILPLIVWMGFSQASVGYNKRARTRGKSGWSLSKKVKVVVDSITAFSYLPIRLMSFTGFMVALTGFLYAGVVVYNGLTGHPPQGWASLMVVLTVLGGIQMIMIGVIGEYLWRALDEARQRPRFIIEAAVGQTKGPKPAEPTGNTSREENP